MKQAYMIFLETYFMLIISNYMLELDNIFVKGEKLLDKIY